MPRSLATQRRFALFCAACLLFNYPLIGLLDREGGFLGVPALVAGVFGLWAALILVLALRAERGGD